MHPTKRNPCEIKTLRPSFRRKPSRISLAERLRINTVGQKQEHYIMNWILIAYLLALIFLATKLEDARRRNSFRAAWITFALIPFWQFIMHLCRAGNLRSATALKLIDIWDLAIPSLLLGISFLCLVGALAPGRPPSEGGNQ
jgi:bacteriorhodopsin